LANQNTCKSNNSNTKGLSGWSDSNSLPIEIQEAMTGFYY